jgi:hypothetical protein
VKVTINAGGREVTIECADANVSPKDLASEALTVWTATAGAKTTEAAYGFVTAERCSPGGNRMLGEGKPVPVHGLEDR